MAEPDINRRDFLKAGALLSGGLLLSFTVPGSGRRSQLASPPDADPSAGTLAPNAFLRIAPDGRITVVLTHVEMGQGVWTTLPLLLAEELDADWQAIHVEHAPVGKAYTHAAYGIQLTGGSSSTWSEFDRYRQAGATARVLLTQAAATRWGVAPAACQTQDGYVIHGSRQFSYGELASEAAVLPVPKEVSLRPPAEWKYIGKGRKRLDAPAKTNGSAIFGMDVQLPGLLTAVVARAPVFGGKVHSFEATKALAVPGVRQVVRVPSGVAVIADHFWAASQGRKALHITWDHGPGASLSTPAQLAHYQRLAATDGRPAQQRGDAVRGLARAAKVLRATYTFPYLAHAALEPLNCTVRLGPGRCEIWTGTQMPDADQAAAANILGLTLEQVTITTPFLGGAFGRRAVPAADFVSEAVHVAKASGQVIKLVWTREDDMKGGYYRPAYVHQLQAGVDERGLPVAWRHNIVGQSVLRGNKESAEGTIQDGIDLTSVEGVAGSPYLSAVPDHFVGLHTTLAAVPVLWFRSVGNTHTAYVMETMLDELAHAAGQDPVAYRRPLLKNHPRHLAALNLVAEQAGWGQPLPAGHFRGVAVHEAFGSFVAHVVEISYQRQQLKVVRVTCAIDCGLAVNPDGVRAQLESAVIFGLTMALYGELTLHEGQVQQSNFYDYRLLRMHEAPTIAVHLVPSAEKMGGAGECGVPSVAPALANALFAATGKRTYHLPILLGNATTV